MPMIDFRENLAIISNCWDKDVLFKYKVEEVKYKTSGGVS